MTQKVCLRLGEYLEQHNLTAYRLATQVEQGRMNTVYRLVRRAEDIKRIDLDVLADIIQGLVKLTGKTVSFDELLEYLPNE